MTTLSANEPYPVRFDVDYPIGARDRVSVLLRIFFVIPVFVLLGMLTGPAVRDGAVSASLGVSIAVLLMLLFRQKYPRWWFDWLLQLNRFGARVGTYFLLLRDEYPATDEEQAVHLQIDYPDATALNRWLPLVKWLLALPHWIVLALASIAALCVSVFAWFAILITGRHPRGAWDFVVGVQRYALRVSGYALLLVTDRYPPFSLD